MTGRILIKLKEAVGGYGEAGDVVEVPRPEADQLIHGGVGEMLPDTYAWEKPKPKKGSKENDE